MQVRVLPLIYLMLLLLTTVPGVEEVVMKELQVRFNLTPIRFEKIGISELAGRVLVELPDNTDLRFITKMRSIEKAFLVMDIGDIGPKREDLEKVINNINLSWIRDYITPYTTFAVRSVRAGNHEYTSPEISRLLGDKIVREVKRWCGFRPHVDLDDPDIVIEFDVIDSRYILGIELLRYSLRDRKYRIFRHEAAINPTLAFAMNVLLEYDPHGEYTLLDPLCGSGTIIIEGLHYYTRSFYIGIDIDRRNCKGASLNCKAANIYNRACIISGDSTRLSKFVKEVDGIVTNPPYGVRLEPVEELGKFYSKMLHEISKVLAQGCRAVIITPRVRIMKSALERTRGLRLVRQVTVEQGGMLSSIFILEKE